MSLLRIVMKEIYWQDSFTIDLNQHATSLDSVNIRQSYYMLGFHQMNKVGKQGMVHLAGT